MRLAAFVILFALLGAVTAIAQTPKEFNNKLVSITKVLGEKGTEWGTKMAQISLGSKNFIELKPLRVEIEKYIDKQVAILQQTKDVKGSKNFRESVITYLQFEKTLIGKGFTPFESYNKKTTEAKVEEGTNNINKLAEKEGTYLKQMENAQKEYAKMNNFTIE